MITHQTMIKALTLAIGLHVMSVSTVHAQSCQSLIWSDEFNGNSLDTSRWDTQIGNGCEYGICNWGNGELQYYKAENATVANGLLSITAKKERVKGNGYTSARLRTANMPNGGQWTHGRFEARIKLPSGEGLWPAFWMLPTDPAVSWPHSGEIDIVEATGQTPMVAHGTIHYAGSSGEHQYSGSQTISQPLPWSDDFHVYAIEWEPNQIRWYLDDRLYAVKTPQDLTDPTSWTFGDNPFHLLLNLAVGGTWGGTPDDSIFPVTMFVDYVRVFDTKQPSIDGSHIVGPQQTVTYTVIDENGTGSNYAWSIPPGATMNGNGNQVTINFTGATSGNVEVSINNSCGDHTLSLPVFVEPNYGVETVLDDFESKRLLTYTHFDGNFVETNGELHYTRESTVQWDVIAADTDVLSDVSALVKGEKAFVLDINNTQSALVGKPIVIQLENKLTATPDNYPGGRHSRYQSFIEHANGWQTLRFRMMDRPDSQTNDTQVTTMVILIDPNSFTGDSYIIDNIAILGEAGSTGSPTYSKVDSLTTTTQDTGKGQKAGVATVTVTDDLGQPIANALVAGRFSGTWNESHNGVTDNNGIVQFVTTTSNKGGVTVNFCVDSVTNTSLPFDGAQSVGMCQ